MKYLDARKYVNDLHKSKLRKQSFSQWKQYRQQVTDYVIANCDADSTIAVFGAGQCDDIDLKRFADHFSAVILIDGSEAAMKRGILKYAQDGNSQIQMVVRDFTGISRLDYRAFAQAIIDMCSGKVDMDKVIRVLDRMYAKAEVHYLDFHNTVSDMDGFDYGLVLGVHSQLNNMAYLIYTGICGEMGRRDLAEWQGDPVRKRIDNATSQIVCKFNDSVFQAVNQKTIIGYEVDVNAASEAIQGAKQAEADLARREELGKFHSGGKRELLWPYNIKEGVLFKMHMQTVTPYKTDLKIKGRCV